MIYLAYLGGYSYKMYKFKDHLIFLHYFVLAVISVTLVQCIFNLSLVQYDNRVGEATATLTLLSCLIEILRQTLARVFTLLIGLGYGILITSIKIYQ